MLAWLWLADTRSQITVKALEPEEWDFEIWQQPVLNHTNQVLCTHVGTRSAAG